MEPISLKVKEPDPVALGFSEPAPIRLSVGDGTSHVARSNAFEVVDGGIVLKSPGGTRYKIAVDDTGNITATAL